MIVPPEEALQQQIFQKHPPEENREKQPDGRGIFYIFQNPFHNSHFSLG